MSDVIETLQEEIRSNSLQMDQLSSDIRELTSVVRDLVNVTEEARQREEIASLAQFNLEEPKH